MTCSRCRTTELVWETDAVVSHEIKGDRVEFAMPAFRCPSCGHVSIRGRQLAVFARLAADVYRNNNGLLTAREIVAAKSRLGLSWPHFAAHVGVSFVQVKRWMRGDVQSFACDRLMRLTTDPDALIRELIGLRSLIEHGFRATWDSTVHAGADAALALRAKRERRGRLLGEQLALDEGQPVMNGEDPKALEAASAAA